MRRVKIALTGLLAAACVLVSSSGNASSKRVAAPHTAAQSAPKSATGEREEGRNLLRRGKAAAALIHLERALGLFKASGDKSGEASTQDLLGELYERQGRYEVARAHYAAALDIYAVPPKGGKPPKVPLGAVARANDAASSAFELAGQESSYNARLMLGKIGNVLNKGGRPEDARTYYDSLSAIAKPPKKRGFLDKALDAAAAAGAGVLSDDRSIRIGVPSGLGVWEAKDELDRYRQAILYASAELGLGRLDFQQHQLKEAQEHFKNALEAVEGDLPLLGNLGQSRRFRAAARTSLGDVAFEQGRYKDAADAYRKAAKGARDDKRDDLAWPAERGLGRSLWRMAEGEKGKKKDELRTQALGSYRNARDAVEKLLAGGVRADEARTTFLATTGDVFEELAGALAESALDAQGTAAQPGAPLEGQASEFASEALSVVERGRARSLLDMLNESGADITPRDVPESLLAERRENQARQAELAAELTGVSLGRSKRKPEDLEKELNDLQEKFDSIKNRIRTQSPPYAQLTAPEPLKLEDIRARVLDDDTALLEYSLGRERSYLFAVTRTGFTVSRLPARAEVERQVTEFRRLLIPQSQRRPLTDLVANAVDAERGLRIRSTPPPKHGPEVVNAYGQAAHALYKSAVEPAAPLFKASRLLVVADGALNYVPFDALLTAAPPQGADFSALPYLIKNNETVFAPSASVVAAVRERARGASTSGASGDVLVVADPVFDEADSRAPAAQTARARPGFESALADLADEGTAAPDASERRAIVRLPGTGEEAHEIEKLARASGRKAELLLDMNASESNVEGRDLSRYRVLHFATHGLLDAERPQFTGVVLSLVGNPEGSDGFLRTDEVFNLKLSSPLVMLSACETGLGRERRGEGVIGLTRAFMYAGAPTVGVTLWSVADKSTAELMTDFYKNLLGGSTPAPSDAMRRARLRMIEGKRFSTPYYWAPFVLVGDWR